MKSRISSFYVLRMFETTFILINLVCGFSRYNIRKIQHFSIIYFILICSLYVISKLRIELSKFYICDCISKITISLYNLNMFFFLNRTKWFHIFDMRNKMLGVLLTVLGHNIISRGLKNVNKNMLIYF